MSLLDQSRQRPVIVTNSLDLISLRETAEGFLERFKDRPQTFRAYRSDLRRLDEYLSAKESTPRVGPMVADFNRSNVELFLRELDAAPSTVERRAACFKSLSQHIAETYYVTDRLRDLKLKRREARASYKALTDEQREAVVCGLPTLPIEHRAVIALMLFCGLRTCEVRDLKLANLGEGLTTLNGVIGKGGRKRGVPLPVPSEAREIIKPFIDWRLKQLTAPEYPVFISRRGSKQRSPESYRRNEKTIYRIVSEHLGALGIPADLARPHTLRHTFAVRALRHLGRHFETARALNLLRQLLGHSSLNTTMIYLTHESKELSCSMEDFR